MIRNVFATLLIFCSLFIQDSFAQNKRKLKQELYFYKGKNYMGISYDTLGREYFRWMIPCKGANVCCESLVFTEISDYKTITTTIDGRIKKNQKLKRKLSNGYDGNIRVIALSTLDSSYSDKFYNFRFKNDKLFYDFKTILQEDVELFKREDSTTFEVNHVIRDRIGNIYSSRKYNNESDDELVQKKTTIFRENLKTCEIESKMKREGSLHITKDIVTAFEHSGEILYASKYKKEQMFNDAGQVVGEANYELNTKLGFPDVWQMTSNVVYTYFEPYVARRDYKLYSKHGKVNKSYTIEIKKSFY